MSGYQHGMAKVAAVHHRLAARLKRQHQIARSAA